MHAPLKLYAMTANFGAQALWSIDMVISLQQFARRRSASLRLQLPGCACVFDHGSHLNCSMWMRYAIEHELLFSEHYLPCIWSQMLQMPTIFLIFCWTCQHLLASDGFLSWHNILHACRAPLCASSCTGRIILSRSNAGTYEGMPKAQ